MNFIVEALRLPPEASTFAVGVDALHAFVFFTALAGCGVILALAGYYIIRYRRRGPPTRIAKPEPGRGIEIGTISLVLFLFILWWAVGYLQFLAQERPPPNAMRVWVTAKQWMWKFAHEDGGVELATLTVPVGAPVVLFMTSRDVVHSFFVPAFRIKQDVLPGRYTEVWFEATAIGEYPIYCAELCGTGHSAMSGVVRVVSDEEWRSARAAPPGRPLVSFGLEAAAQHGCLSCHSLDGAPRLGPTWLGLYGATRTMIDGETLVADDAYLTQSMMEPTRHIVTGFAPVMPSYAGVLEPFAAGAIVELIRGLDESARGLP